MKKFLFTFVMALGFVACGGNVTSTNTEDATDSTEVVVDSAMVDSTMIDTISSGCTADTVVIAD